MCLELEKLFGMRISCIAVMPAEIKATVCLGLYILKLKVCVRTFYRKAKLVYMGFNCLNTLT